MIDKRIGKRIKQCREQIGLTQEQFAEKLGVATNYISMIERGASFPRCERLIAIINGLEASADAIFCDDCGEQIVETRAKDGRIWTPENIKGYSERKFGRCLCTRCQKAEKAARGGR